MVALSKEDQERVYFHLGIGSRAGVDAGDIAQIEEAFNTIPSDYQLNRIIEQLDICDVAWETARLVRADNSRFTTKEQYTGDINRAVLREAADDIQIWQRNYLNETRELAQLLWVPNYREQGMDKYRYERSAGAFIKSIPGIADTSIASKLQQWWDLGGGWGVHKGFIRDDDEIKTQSEYLLKGVFTPPNTSTNEFAIYYDNIDNKLKLKLQNDSKSLDLYQSDDDVINLTNFYG